MGFGFGFDWDAPVPEEERERLLGKMAAEVARRGLETPAIWMLEIHRPVMPVVGQLSIAFSPFLGAFMTGGILELQRYTKLMRRRENIDRLVAMIEDRVAERDRVMPRVRPSIVEEISAARK
jgi:hypothetical protein